MLVPRQHAARPWLAVARLLVLYQVVFTTSDSTAATNDHAHTQAHTDAHAHAHAHSLDTMYDQGAVFAPRQCSAIETKVLVDGAEVSLRLSYGSTVDGAVRKEPTVNY